MTFCRLHGFTFFDVSGEESNPFANPETAGDGGGYFQPSGTGYVVTPTGHILEWSFCDSSIGDFGTRFSFSFRDVFANRDFGFSFGSADDVRIVDDEEFEYQCHQWYVMNRTYRMDTAELCRVIRHLVEKTVYGYDTWHTSLLKQYLGAPMR